MKQVNIRSSESTVEETRPYGVHISKLRNCVREWLAENCKGEYVISEWDEPSPNFDGWYIRLGYQFTFQNDEDAMMFKLVWA